jgi:hypothetical protein
MHHVHPYITFLHYSLPYNCLSQLLNFCFSKNNPLARVASFLLQMATPVFPPHSSTFLDQFGMPTLLWSVLSSVGYPETPHYTWVQTVLFGDVPWYNMTLVVPQNPMRPLGVGGAPSRMGKAHGKPLKLLLLMCLWT